MKTPRSDRIRKGPELPFSTPSPETKSQNNGGKNLPSMENEVFHQNGLRETVKRERFASLTTQHLRSRREIDATISENNESSTACANSTVTLKYEDEYKVWNNFSMMYKGRMYHHNEYRVMDDGLQVCNTSELSIQRTWRNFTAREKRMIASKQCNVSVHGFYHENYTLFKNLTVFFKPTGQTFARQDYGVIFGHFAICSAKLSLSCNDDLVKVMNSEQYNLFITDFSLFHNNKTYDYREYRFNNDILEICDSNDSRVQAIWKTQNSWEKFKDWYKCNGTVHKLPVKHTVTVDMQFTVYYAVTSQYFRRNDYVVRDGEPYVCKKKLRPNSAEYTQKDLLMCNDSIINIRYEDEYNVWTNFSILYKNKVYNYTEYRLLNEGIKICNSTDNFVRNIWKVRNGWLKATMHFKNCNESNRNRWLYQPYALRKDFAVYLGSSGQFFTRKDYGVRNGKLDICQEKLGPDLIEYTQEDLLMCNDSIISIKYDEGYKVWNNFSILYKNKGYDYTDYRVMKDGIKTCNSTDNYERNIWKARNIWVEATRHYKGCDKPITYTEYNPGKYTVLEGFKVLIQKTNQVIPRYDYGVFQGKLTICDEKLIFYLTNMKIIILPLCSLALSFICLLLLLIIYCMLPELRTLPGLNLMSLSFAFLLWQTYLVAFLSLYSRIGKQVKVPCAWLFVTTKFITYSILTNAAVNMYHLRKTFCGNTLVKTDVNKWQRFLKYTLFSWGIPVIITIVYIILVKEDALRFDQHVFIKNYTLQLSDESIDVGQRMASKEYDVRVYQHIIGECNKCRITPDWSDFIDVYGFQGCLVLYVIVIFFFTAYRLRQKLKASSGIAQKSNIAKNHKFVILLKLSTTTALTYWFPLFISEINDFNFVIKLTLYTVTLLTGAYIGIAFVFTRRNYRLLKKKYSPAKHMSVSKIAQV